MDKQTNPAAKIFAIILLILFVLTGVAALLIFNSFNQAFNPSLYKHALSDAGVYENLPDLIGEQIVYQVDRNPCIQDAASCSGDQKTSNLGYLKSIDRVEWKAILSRLIDPVWFQTQTESAIDQVFSFLKNPGQPFKLDLSLMEFKTRLSGEDGYQAMMLLFHSLEPCRIEDLLKLPMSIINPTAFGAAELCQPSESVLKVGEEAIRTLLNELAATLPDNTSTIFQGVSSGLSANLAASLHTLQVIRLAAVISPIVPLFLLFLVTLLVVRNLKGFLTWWGIPLLILGALTFGSALFILPATRASLIVRFQAQGLAPDLVGLLKTVILNIARSFETALLVQSSILVIAGIVMIIAAAVLSRKPEANPGT